jgi:GrpB-like predicted nucleotidyltransferase (UPF0157 family)
MTDIEIIPYDPNWPSEFAAIAASLRTALGDLALRIDHIGSTSVPGLDAKDVIDIQVTVEELDRNAIASALEPLGYAMRDDITGDHIPAGAVTAPEEWAKLYVRAPEGQRPTHVHIRQAGRANQRYALLFRDALRANPSTAATYGQIKRVIARLHPNDVYAYYDIKDPACDLIMDMAGLWASGTSYIPGPSDG